MTENRKRVTVTVSVQNRKVTANASPQDASKSVAVGALPVRAAIPEFYEGEYDVSPDFEGRVLNTRQRYLTDNITIDPIYISDTSNLAGGITIYIGGEFNV